MFMLRHKVFVEGKGWKKLERESGLDIDQFDTDEATYFVKLSQDGTILGGMRIVPTTTKNQLNTIFKHWCTFEDPPSSEVEWEWSRYFISDKTFRSNAGFPVFYELFFGILEYAVSQGIKGLSGFLEAHTLPRLSKLPWDLKYLGPIVTYGKTHGETEGKGAPVHVTVNARMLKITKRMKRMTNKYFAIPLGPDTLVSDKAFEPSICFQFLNFAEKHPEHLDNVVQMVDLCGGVGGVDILDQLSLDEAQLTFESLSQHGFSETSGSFQVGQTLSH
jgi:acyl-homoserine lactone synthase